MKKALFLLDEKGIIAPDTAAEEDYVNLGNLILETADNFMMNDGFNELFLNEGIKADAAFRMPPPVAMLLKRVFRTDLSWVVVVPGAYMDPEPTALATRLPCMSKGRAMELPIISYFHGGEHILFHEGIHVTRSFINSGDAAFEEAFANYIVPHPVHKMVETELLYDNKLVIDDAKKKLEDVIGGNAAYALVRLLKDEVYALKDSSDALGYLKGLNCLRHRIVKERLGL
ncbi:MAG: hypothetical protein KJ955_05200 [Nanoarchaeota archaeon]|nr:hypothetical protein [Nanoarchaeota archaeon]